MKAKIPKSYFQSRDSLRTPCQWDQLRLGRNMTYTSHVRWCQGTDVRSPFWIYNYGICRNTGSVLEDLNKLIPPVWLQVDSRL